MTVSSKVHDLCRQNGENQHRKASETRFVEIRVIRTPVQAELGNAVPEAIILGYFKDLVAQDSVDAVMLVTHSGLHNKQVFASLQYIQHQHVFCEASVYEHKRRVGRVLRDAHLKDAAQFPRR
ncbi:hypothetical protein V1520DRAFT_214522 [Lipomyces starkeyi]|uniref:Uncharacterized protein n=1 Tax=Lipomyces starkeyi NRRL Y-11557 TaxID=675824 RepID=A0A1E3PXT7_LIPST|nr:hypothetical protein LIPSTDRAFT_107351 [Lipomyces starkeyi NRRL Y-11557]